MAKDSKDGKKEKREKKEKKERKRREAEELAAVKEKKISKKHKSKSKEAEKPEKKPKKKSKKLEQVEEKPHKKPKKKQKKPDESESESEEEDPETVTVPSNDSHQIKLPIPPTTTTTNDYDSDSDFDKEDIKHLLESYTKEDLINLIYKTAEKGSKLISAVLESADRDSSKRNIFVRGLGWDTTHETLKSAFEAYGEIEDCSVVMDKDTGRAKGYGFVMFKTRKACREALRHPEKRMFNRTVSCNIAAAKPAGAGKFQREPVVESVKIDLNQKEVVLPGGLDVGVGYVNGPDKGQQHQQNMGMYGGQNVPFYGHGYNPMYAAAFMGNQMGSGVPNFPMFGPGMMNHGPPPNHMGMTGQFGGEGNGVGPGGFDGERAWYLR
ncbi:unnamed protein product [Eruca vesicaria subsp. sativa]|uniref:RRM domain-containing protein n=1 Tax=Eruca vesicaria subsp. sativa TaxID=29727 RepID=A0ABC8K1Z2_ERUVS|nr:unnamed protein product [Eruca vesicaria subsp. sativa]